MLREHRTERCAAAVALHRPALRAVGPFRRAFSTLLRSLLLGTGAGKVLVPPQRAQGWSLRESGMLRVLPRTSLGSRAR